VHGSRANLPRNVFAHLSRCLSQGDNVHEPNFGCRGVQLEWEASGRRALLARECMHRLVTAAQVRALGMLG
jgi:hypothetical protein